MLVPLTVEFEPTITVVCPIAEKDDTTIEANINNHEKLKNAFFVGKQQNSFPRILKVLQIFKRGEIELFFILILPLIQMVKKYYSIFIRIKIHMFLLVQLLLLN